METFFDDSVFVCKHYSQSPAFQAPHLARPNQRAHGLLWPVKAWSGFSSTHSSSGGGSRSRPNALPPRFWCSTSCKVNTSLKFAVWQSTSHLNLYIIRKPPCWCWRWDVRLWTVVLFFLLVVFWGCMWFCWMYWMLLVCITTQWC